MDWPGKTSTLKNYSFHSFDRDETTKKLESGKLVLNHFTVLMSAKNYGRNQLVAGWSDASVPESVNL